VAEIHGGHNGGELRGMKRNTGEKPSRGIAGGGKTKQGNVENSDKMKKG